MYSIRIPRPGRSVRFEVARTAEEANRLLARHPGAYALGPGVHPSGRHVMTADEARAAARCAA